MSHLHQKMVDGAEFWISCEWLKALRKASQWQLIKCSPPSTVCWCQCDIRIGNRTSPSADLLHMNTLNKNLLFSWYLKAKYCSKLIIEYAFIWYHWTINFGSNIYVKKVIIFVLSFRLDFTFFLISMRFYKKKTEKTEKTEKVSVLKLYKILYKVAQKL